MSEINEEMLNEVKKSAPYVLAAAVLFAGYHGIKNYRASSREAASAALTQTYAVEDMEEAVSKYGDSQAGCALKIKLAKKYYDAERYEEALALYEELCGSADAAFADIPQAGRAQTLEAMGRTDDAMKAYTDFVAENPQSYLALTANLGIVRCMAKTDKPGALAKLAELKDTVKDDAASVARVDALKETIERL